MDIENEEIDNSAMRKNNILPFATTWMDLVGTVLSGVSQTEEDKWNPKKKKKKI